MTKKVKWPVQMKVVLIALAILVLLPGFFVKRYLDKSKNITEAPVSTEVKSTPTPSSAPNVVVAKTAQPTSKVTTDKLVELINIERKSRGLKSLAVSGKVTSAAVKRVNYLVANNQWSHDGFQEAVDSSGLVGRVGEILSRNNTDLEAVQMWINSPLHAEQMFNSSYRYMGVGRNANYIVVWFSQN